MKKNIIRSITYSLLIVCLIYLFEHLLMHSRYMQVFTLTESIFEDISLNDLYYRKFENSNGTPLHEKDKKVILINSHDIPNTRDGRLMYCALIDSLLAAGVPSIGIDICFNRKLDNVFAKYSNNPNVIFADDGNNRNIQFKHSGNVEFPDKNTIRFYQNNKNSFAAKLVTAKYPKFKTRIGNQENFVLHYNTLGEGITYKTDTKNGNLNFRYYNSRDILTKTRRKIKRYTNDCIVIIGYLGDKSHFNGRFDIEDKHCVPVDMEHMVNRAPTMHGATIHAVAISNILDKDTRFYQVSPLWQGIINAILGFGFLQLLLFYHISKIKSRIILISGSFLLIYMVVWLMGQGIYFQIGMTLLSLAVIEEFFEIIEHYENLIFNSKKS